MLTQEVVGGGPVGPINGEDQALEEVLAAVFPIIDGVDLPVSVDLEAGYRREPAELIATSIDSAVPGSTSRTPSTATRSSAVHRGAHRLHRRAPRRR